jgi:two-component system chemotaxis response regulator CheY
MAQRVLVADDSGVMRTIIIRSLNAIGVTDIVQASDGVDAIEKFEAGTFDIVLTDWNMPNKSGLDVLKAIRAQGSDVPVIMITTENEKGASLGSDPGWRHGLPGQALRRRSFAGKT